MSRKAVGAVAIRTKLGAGRFLIRPYAAAGNPRDIVVAVLCISLLGVVFLAEILTPHDVVGALAVLPLLAAMWVLSSRLAALVAFVALLLFVVVITVETASGLTVISVGVAVFLTAAGVRLYATSLAGLLAGRRYRRPNNPILATPTTLAGIDASSHGMRSLTRRELDVARLAAEGYTAADIGHRLYIGQRTVESHLSSVYSKLRINSKAQLIRLASREASIAHSVGRDSKPG